MIIMATIQKKFVTLRCRKITNNISMPTLYKYFGLSFFFYANEHLPIHIHIEKGNRAAKAVFVMNNGKLDNILLTKIPGAEMLTPSETNSAKELLETKQEEIVKFWTDFFVRNKKDFKTITITKRVKI